MSQLSPNLTR